MWVWFAWSILGLSFGDLLVSCKVYSLINQYHFSIYSLTRSHPLVGRMESDCRLSVRCSCLNPIRRNNIRWFSSLASVWLFSQAMCKCCKLSWQTVIFIRNGFPGEGDVVWQTNEVKTHNSDRNCFPFIFICQHSVCWCDWLIVCIVCLWLSYSLVPELVSLDSRRPCGCCHTVGR